MITEIGEHVFANTFHIVGGDIGADSANVTLVEEITRQNFGHQPRTKRRRSATGSFSRYSNDFLNTRYPRGNEQLFAFCLIQVA